MRVLQGDSQEGVGEAHLGSHCSVAMIPPRLCTSIQTVLWGLDLAIPSFTFFFLMADQTAAVDHLAVCTLIAKYSRAICFLSFLVREAPHEIIALQRFPSNRCCCVMGPQCVSRLPREAGIA